MAAISRNTFSCITRTDEPGAFERWKDQVWATHDVRPLPRNPRPTMLQCTAHQIGPLLICESTSGPSRRERTRAHASRDNLDHYGLHIQQEGRCTSEVTTGRTLLEPGDIRIIDLAQPEAVTTTIGAATILYVARDLIDAAIPGFHTHHGRVLRGQAATQLTSFIASLPTYVQSIPEPGLPGFVDAAMTYIVSSLLAHQHTDAAGSGARLSYLRQAVVSHIDLHLADPALSPGSVSAAMGLSRSALYRLFPMEGGIARLIRIRRLRRVRRAIQQDADTRPIGHISSDFGFTSATQFWRAFRQEYGYPPGELRTRATTGITHTSSPASLTTLMYCLYQETATRPLTPAAMGVMWAPLS